MHCSSTLATPVASPHQISTIFFCTHSARLPCRVLRLPLLCRYNSTHPPPLYPPRCMGRKNKGCYISTGSKLRGLRTEALMHGSTVVLIGFTCPAITVGTVILRALERVRERARGCFARSPKSPLFFFSFSFFFSPRPPGVAWQGII